MNINIGDELFLSSGDSTIILRVVPHQRDRTQADRIRGMSDEGLAELLYIAYSDGLRDGMGKGITGPWKVVGNWSDWLQQPAETEGTE